MKTEERYATRSGRFAAALLALAALAPLRADVLIVDAADPAAFPDVISAVEAAQPDDVVLVRPGDYTSLFPTVVDRSLTIMGDGDDVLVNGFLIEDLAPADRVVLRGLEVGGGYTYSSAVTVTDSLGVVLIEDCTLLGMQTGGHGLRADDSPRIIVSSSMLIGTDGGNFCLFDNLPAGDGAQLIDVTAAFYHSALTGGRGCSAAGVENATGGCGLRVQGASSDVRLFGATLTGGDSGTCNYCMTTSKTGGDGLLVEDGAIVRAVETLFDGGWGTVLPGIGTTLPGEDVNLLDDSVLLTWADDVPEFTGPGILREGETDRLVIRGEPGELVRLYLSFDIAFAPLPGKKGVFVPGTPLLGPVPLAVMPPSGELEIPMIGPFLFGFQSVLSTWQAYTRVDGSSELVMSNPYELLLLDHGL